MDRYYRGSSRSRGSSSIASLQKDPREKVKDCCRKVIAFLCTQIGVGALVLGYTLVGASCFMHIESVGENTKRIVVNKTRIVFLKKLYVVAETCNIFDEGNFSRNVDKVLKDYQKELVKVFQHGYDERKMSEVWTFPAALMFSLSIITMIGYGNLVPRTSYGKMATVIYALFGIPLYILYFLNVGDALAGCFRWVYRRLYRCSTQMEDNDPPRRIIVPSTACLWLMAGYVITGAIMFGAWERWNFLDSIYFCVTSLCKLGLGDYVPGANISNGNETKLVINFAYLLFGLGLIAMCYNLMREEIREKLKELGEDFTQCLEDTRMRFFVSCNRARGFDEEFVY